MDGYTLYDYWFILYRRRWTVLLIVLFSLGFAGILSWVLPPVYQAKSVFFVPAKSNALAFFSGADSMRVSRFLLAPEARGEQQKIFVGMLDSEALRQKVRELYPRKSLRSLKKDIDFKSGSDFLIEVYARDRDPKQAAGIANAYVRLFDRTLNSYSLNTTAGDLATMKQELAETEKKLAAARQNLTSFLQENKIAKVDQESDTLVKFRNELQKDSEETKVKLEETTIKLNSLQGQFAKESDSHNESAILALTNPLIETLQKQLSDLESQLAGARAKYTDSHPEVASLRAQYAQKKKDLSEEVKRSMESTEKSPNSFLENLRQEMVRLFVDKETLRARIDGLAKAIAAVGQQITIFPAVQARYQELNREVDQYQKLSENLKTAIEEAAAQQQRDIRNVVVVDEALPPDEPAFPDPVLNLFVALGLGAVGGIFYAYFIDYVDRLKLNLEEDIKELEGERV